MNIFIDMGRKKIYITEDDQRLAHNKRSLSYYYKNLFKCRKKRMERYYEKINNK